MPRALTEPEAGLPERLRETLHVVTDEINPALNIGITGTRAMTENPQRLAFSGMLGRIATHYPGTVAIHHGCCTGADELAHCTAQAIPGVLIYGYPGRDSRGRSPYRMASRSGFTTLYSPDLYAERNRVIAQVCTIMLAAPAHPESDAESLRSGTWQTIRFARRMRKAILYVMADGSVTLDTGFVQVTL